MKVYILKRLLIMVPTFFAITLVVFVIINAVPGEPTRYSFSEETSEYNSEGTEQRRIFQNRFNLDKPIIFNLRFLTTEREVEKLLADSIDRPDRGNLSRRRDALEKLVELGEYAVPNLVEIANKTRDHKVQDLAIQILNENEQLGLMGVKENVGDIEPKTTPAQWQAWFDDVKNERYSGGIVNDLRVFFFDTRFACYLSSLARLDFGVSYIDKKPIFPKVISSLKYSLALAIPALLFAYAFAIILGAVSAAKKRRASDKLISIISFALYSMPGFFLATIVLLLFSKGSDCFPLFPTSGLLSDGAKYMTTIEKIGDIAWHLVLPVFCMTLGIVAILTRYFRAELIEVLEAYYIRAARAKGLSELDVILKHALKNGIIPLVTVLGTALPSLLAGSVIIEVVFGIPGMGRLAYEAVMSRDYNTILAVQLISALIVMAGVFLADLLHARLDPRINFD